MTRKKFNLRYSLALRWRSDGAGIPVADFETRASLLRACAALNAILRLVGAATEPEHDETGSTIWIGRHLP